MEQDGAQTPYEVYCTRCRVTFPIGTRKCIHCGERVGRDRFQPALGLLPGGEEISVEPEPARRSGLSPFTLVWVALLLGGYLYRACAS
jgi:hypothetical protein